MLPMILMASSVMSVLSPGETMPPLKGEFLTGRQALLPGAASGRVALLALGFTYDSRFAVEAWVSGFRKDFRNSPQVAFYEVQMIGGLARLGFQLPDAAHLILLDRRGVVRWRHSGVLDEEAYQGLSIQVAALLREPW